MIDANRNRWPHKYFGKNKVVDEEGAHSGGSQFVVLVDSDVSGKGVTVGNNNGGVDSVLAPSTGVEKVAHVHVDAGGQSSSRMVLQQVNDPTEGGSGIGTVQIVSSGGVQVPQVVSHAVDSVASIHAAVAIPDATNKKRRQRMLQKGTVLGRSRKANVPPRLDTNVVVLGRSEGVVMGDGGVGDDKGYANYFRVEVNGLIGGIWLLWSDVVDVEVLRVSNQFVHGHVCVSGSSWWVYFTAVYASPNATIRRRVWDLLSALRPEGDTMWLLGGDFNSILRLEERSGGSTQGNEVSALFQDFNFDNGLLEASYMGMILLGSVDHPQFEEFLRNNWDMSKGVESNIQAFTVEVQQ
ncbi:hypothetical protein V6N11_037714 [Hibiscus sabdariffa]|uniref:Endonuclease/exonuclease/phosphatase domain-containing protein n=1 Tax=Hibiscus sabdariffa TaxID=183260 RepID=A0ABR2PCW1_9ROSI